MKSPGRENGEPSFSAADFHSESEIVIDDPQDILVRDGDFCLIVAELVNNCLDQGAKKVVVTVKTGKIVIEDDVEHKQTELVTILDNIKSDRPRTTKPTDPELGFPVGGIGILSVRETLREYRGQLVYETTQGGRIKAIVTWQ